MTGITGGGSAFIHSINMAGGTGYRRVLARQWKGSGRVVHGSLCPAGRIVAGDTIGAVSSVVGILCFVARIAVFRRALIHSINMAGGTGYRRMFARQCKIGLASMVDSRGGPTSSGMAAGAVGTHYCAVW